MKALVGAFNQEKTLIGAFSVIVKTDGSSAALVQMSVSPAPEQCTVVLSLSQIRSWSWPGYKGNIFTILLHFRKKLQRVWKKYKSVSMREKNIEKYRDLKIYLQSMWSDWPLLCSMLFDNLFVNIQRYKGSTSFDLFIYSLSLTLVHYYPRQILEGMFIITFLLSLKLHI